MKKKIFFRADGNSQIGLGHVVRCLALAEILEPHFLSFFLIQSPSESIQKKISEFCVPLALPSIPNHIEEIYFLSKTVSSSDIIVLDGNGFNAEYQKNIKEIIGAKLICIDDLHLNHFYADVVINHNPSIADPSYSREPYTKLYLGFEYLLIRKLFLDQIKAKREILVNKNLFICIGGADPNNLTLKILKACKELEYFNKINIVTGAAYQNSIELKKFILQTDESTSHFSDLSALELINVMRDSGIAIVPSSSIALELMCVGINMITGYFVEDQKELSAFIHENGLGISIGDFNSYDNNSLKKVIFENLEVNTVERQKNLIINSPSENLIKIFNEL
jgi:UDP-2,4-diacetamido-2,4,6-trideoxy-beta-L-altropyranose hydrolase